MEDNTTETLLSLIKVLDKAILLEHSAYSFYSAAADIASDSAGISLFNKLAEEERRHASDLDDHRRLLAGHLSVKGHIPVLESDESLNEFSNVFSYKPGMSSEEILHEAIKNERKMYAYYTMKETHADNPSLKLLFNELAQDEDDHWAALKAQLHNFQSGHGWVEQARQ